MGYKNISHFSRQCKRWTGESPSEFRHKFHSR
ncbi:AraC family transcriptional regulator [Paenibacillus polygoni]|uniref:AraC family transcriptional regulator n=1 Tax=Paenibacillus polygoni TaxID=3050112 RepID=A0ABY8X1X9_9BACL|nr:AraC family transcriptional regulator [Paenibacillus polygoni]WIV19530.1 AraC family transcriptional regulator [Paenibacillus polygoni]